MKISNITVFRKDLKLKKRYWTANVKLNSVDEVFLKIGSDDGVCGFGEVRGNNHYVTGETPESIITTIRDFFAPFLVGKDPFKIHLIMSRLERMIEKNSGAKALVDIALHDLVCNALQIPLFNLIGGRSKTRIPTNTDIDFGSQSEAQELARKYYDEGYKFIKLKVGMRPFRKDLERAKAVRAEVGHEAMLAVDANQAWSATEAIRNIEKMEKYDLAYVEQPVTGRSILSLKLVTDKVKTPIMADEAVHSAGDLLRIIRLRAADMAHLKIAKTGGITGMLRAISVAQTADFPFVIGHMLQGRMGTAAALHCAATVDAYWHELFGFERISDDPTTGFDVVNGEIEVPEGSGLGVEIDEDALEKVLELP